MSPTPEHGDAPVQGRTVPAAPRSWLYVPGHRPDRIAKALRAGADAVVIDLEDAVPAQLKDTAREACLAVLAERPAVRGRGATPVWVRVNSPRDELGQRDLAALAGAAADGLRLPRCDDPALVAEVAEATGHLLHLLVESAGGLARLHELARCHPGVRGISLGEADLAADLLVGDDAGLDWARGAVVVAARAAGLGSPVQSVYTDVADLAGLRASSQAGRSAGFFGRSVVHPRQVEIVHEVFTPTPEQVRRAESVVATAEDAAARGEAAVLDADGRFVDPAVVHRARAVLARVPVGSTTHLVATHNSGGTL